MTGTLGPLAASRLVWKDVRNVFCTITGLSYASAALSSFEMPSQGPHQAERFSSGSEVPSPPGLHLELRTHLPVSNAEFRAAKLVPRPRGPPCLPSAPFIASLI